MKRLLIFGWLILTASIVGQEIKHAPTFQSCQADLNLWTSQIPGFPTSTSEQDQEGTESLTVHEMTNRMSYLNDCARPAVSGDGTIGTVCPVHIWVLWVHQDVKEDGWPYLLDAFDALVREEYDRVIVPAQSAVEITLMPIIRELLERHSSIDHVKGFMGDRLTFGNVVNVVLPFMCAQAGVPKMPDSVRGAMNKLRQLRNDLVHKGERRASISKTESGEALCAAVFGFEYARYVRPQLLERLK